MYNFKLLHSCKARLEFATLPTSSVLQLSSFIRLAGRSNEASPSACGAAVGVSDLPGLANDSKLLDIIR